MEAEMKQGRNGGSLGTKTAKKRELKEIPMNFRYGRVRNLTQKVLRSQIKARHNTRRAYLGSSEGLIKRLTLEWELEGHSGCVNTVRWNDEGSLVVSGSDDTFLNIYNPYKRKLLATIPSGHTGNIFHGIFLHGFDNRLVASCAADGEVRLSDVELGTARKVAEHRGMAHKVASCMESPQVILSCSEDGCIRSTDTRIGPTAGSQVITRVLNEQKIIGLYSMDVHPLHSFTMAVVAKDEHTRVFDRRIMRKEAMRPDKVRPVVTYTPSDQSLQDDLNYQGATGVAYSWDGREIVSTYHSGRIFLFTTHQDKVCRQLKVPIKIPKRSHAEVKISTGLDGNPVQRSQSAPEHKCHREKRSLTAWKAQWWREKDREEKNLGMSSSSSGQEPKVKRARISHLVEDSSEDSMLDGKLTMSEVGAYKGHLNLQTVKEVNFLGPRSKYIISGSDDGRIFIWRKSDGELVQLLRGDRDVVNVIQPSPDGNMLISSGIEDTLKIWRPLRSTPNPMLDAKETLERNQRTLERGGSTGGFSASMLMMLLAQLSDNMGESESEDMDIIPIGQEWRQ